MNCPVYLLKANKKEREFMFHYVILRLQSIALQSINIQSAERALQARNLCSFSKIRKLEQ